MFFTTWRDLQGCAASSTCIQNRKAPESILDTVMWGLKSSKLKIMKFMFQIWWICRMVMPVIKILPKSIVAAGGKKLHFGYIGLGLRLATRICQRDSTCFWTKKSFTVRYLYSRLPTSQSIIKNPYRRDTNISGCFPSPPQKYARRTVFPKSSPLSPFTIEK